jgi:CheY-like chemotaxis protein/HPt (histidine-containing phosphotransfer) domain-containing protein
MNGVIGTAEWLKFTNLDAEQRDGIQTIVESGRSLLTIIDDILDFTKVEAGRMKLEAAPMSLCDLCEGVADALMPVAKNRHVDLHLFIDPSLPAQIMGDPNRLRQLMFNLVGNAIKFGSGTAEKPGQVDVHIQPADDGSQSWQLLVSDDGIGMSQQTLQHLFTPFTQAEASTTRRFGGTGLGLAICHRLIELMGGGIEAHSMPGHGATFIATLPMHLPDGATDAPGVVDLTGIDCLLLPGRNYRIDTFSSYLEHAGARVHTCRDAHEAQALAHGKDLAVVIRDTPDPADAAQHDELATSPPDGRTRCLLIGRHLHGPVRIEASHMAQLGRTHVQDLLTAVAVLAGRQSPEVVQNESDEFDALCASIRQDGALHHANERLILVAEDDGTNQRVIKRQLSMLGLECEIAHNGREALDMWRSGRFDILLSDLHMPEIDGYELARRIRREETRQGKARTPIVALTANALISEENRALACGMDEYLTKPISPKELHRCLKQWLPSPKTTLKPAPADEPQRHAGEQRPPDPAQFDAPLDIHVLRQLVGDDEAIIQELLIEFNATTRQQGEALSRACAESDREQMARLAHQLKSSARSVGAHRLGHLCEEAERCAKANNPDMASVRGLLDELRQVHLHLESLIREATP